VAVAVVATTAEAPVELVVLAVALHLVIQPQGVLELQGKETMVVELLVEELQALVVAMVALVVLVHLREQLMVVQVLVLLQT
jgi:hypothetical protein